MKYLCCFIVAAFICGSLQAQTYQGCTSTYSAYCSCSGNSTTSCTTTNLNLSAQGIGVVAGQTIVALAHSTTSGATLGVSDSEGDSFAACAGPQTESSPLSIDELFCGTVGSTNSSYTMTFTASISTNSQGGAYSLFSGGYTVVDKNHSQNWTGTSMLSGATSTTSVASELIVGGFGSKLGSSPTMTAGGVYTMPFYINTNSSAGIWALEYKSVTSTGAQTATGIISSSTSGNGLIVTLKQSSSTQSYRRAHVY